MPAPENHDRQHQQRAIKRRDRRIHDGLKGSEEPAGQCPEQRPVGERELLVLVWIDAHRGDSALMLADPTPHETDPREAKPSRAEVTAGRDHQDQEIERGDPREFLAHDRGGPNAGEPYVAAREASPVDQHQAEDLGEREGDQGQVVPEEPERRDAQEVAEDEGDPDRGQQRQPERGSPVAHQKRDRVCPEGKIRDIAQVKLPGVGDDRVVPERQHVEHEDQDRDP